MRQKIAAGNWKMNLTYQEGAELVEKLSKNLPKDGTMVILGVPYLYLSSFVKATAHIKGIAISAQNCHHEEEGAYTGEVSISMLDSIGIKHVIVGHSERRQYNNETNAMIKTKVDLCIANNMIPIYCCGESLDIRDSGDHVAYVKGQIEESLLHLSAEDIAKVIIAYEPIWAIGTGVTASPEQAQEMHNSIRNILKDKYGAVAENISILYGGSVKPGNAQEIFAKADVDGGLVGGASLDAVGFLTIANSF
jgi:triosephosphate isomerase (TIM)